MNTPECGTHYVTSIRTHNSQRTEHKYIDQGEGVKSGYKTKGLFTWAELDRFAEIPAL